VHDVEMSTPAGTRTTGEPVLEMSGVVKDYRGLRPLRVQSLSLLPGHQVALLGFDEPAAEMMTTLITGAALPDSGTIRVFDTPTTSIEDSDQWLRLVDRIGIVTERAALLDALSVIQNLAIPFTLDIEPPAEDIRQRASTLAAEVGVPASLLHEPVGGLDAEWRMRIRLARALSLGPSLLLLEHPTAQIGRGAVGAFAADLRNLSRRRHLATLTLTADAEFAEGAAALVMRWEPATGLFHRRRSRWWPGRLV
jgi:ABC-type transporter Mla maintaining outer membrane lipid asymmetry ATPase subunit MlaF